VIYVAGNIAEEVHPAFGAHGTVVYKSLRDPVTWLMSFTGPLSADDRQYTVPGDHRARDDGYSRSDTQNRLRSSCDLCSAAIVLADIVSNPGKATAFRRRPELTHPESFERKDRA
jgi:hypothetical protein